MRSRRDAARAPATVSLVCYVDTLTDFWTPSAVFRIRAQHDMTLAKRLKAMGSAKYQTDGDARTSSPGFGVAVHEQALATPFG